MTDKPAPDADGTVRLTPATPRVKVKPAPAAATKAPAPRVVAPAADAPGGGTVKKADFIDRVVARSGVKKKDAKPAIEATLAEIAAIMADGGELILPPVGKLKTVKVKDVGEGAQMLTLKLRTTKDPATPAAMGNTKSGVAEDADDS
ncbi:DNA-binding protein [Loktanella atrilutea]|uniref:DNA-binding protein n=1 Tax=Loktanella atrilutea TaxID=366533 RepID=A0A1M4UUZ4_LOKAT|nr:HU family DNA-binding protein [Loktanella atrilutea]SHE60536.1 DNA-binding protein [Loktanella atrilutea]